jgi:urea carboxylase
MPGTVAKVFVSKGQQVKKGDNLLAVESMKMEYMIKATHDVAI